jgi:hypothetical protein
MMSYEPIPQDQGVRFVPGIYPDILIAEITGPPSTHIQDIWPGTPSQVTMQPIQSRASITGSAIGVQYDYVMESEDTQAHLRAQNAPVLLLDVLAQENDRQAFIMLAEGIIWSFHHPEELLHAIDLALHLGLSSLAINLAKRGADLFPGHERIRQAASVIAPPVVRTEPGREVRGLEDSKIWLEEHASEYRGQWVAVRDGNLLKAATSLKDLKQVIGDGEEAARTLVTKVL